MTASNLNRDSDSRGPFVVSLSNPFVVSLSNPFVVSLSNHEPKALRQAQGERLSHLKWVACDD